MRCRLRYCHHNTNSDYYFVDIRSVNGELRPVGCFPYRKRFATVFETKKDADDVIKYLVSLGCKNISLERV